MSLDNPLRGNKFQLLAEVSSPKNKRKKTQNITEQIFSSPSPNANNMPKYITITSTDEQKPLSKFSVFAKKKALDCISTEYQKVNILKDGSLLVLVNSQKVADKFIKTKSFGGLCPVNITLHQNLNSCKGTIYDRNLIPTSQEEILEDLKEQGVIDVYKFNKMINDQPTPTGQILLTFNLFKIPEHIDIAWYSVNVKQYFPNPMRCKKCQLLGHTNKRCQNNPSCSDCNLPPHPPEPCSRLLCANCQGNHSASSNICPKYQQQKEILKISTLNKCNLAEARKIYKQTYTTNFNLNNSYAAIASQANSTNIGISSLKTTTTTHNGHISTSPNGANKDYPTINNSINNNKNNSPNINSAASHNISTTSNELTKTKPVTNLSSNIHNTQTKPTFEKNKTAHTLNKNDNTTTIQTNYIEITSHDSQQGIRATQYKATTNTNNINNNTLKSLDFEMTEHPNSETSKNDNSLTITTKTALDKSTLYNLRSSHKHDTVNTP